MGLNFALSSFITLFIIVDPVVNVPLFMSILSDFNQNDRHMMVKKAVIVGAIVLSIFTIAGNKIFDYLGIEMYSFRIAGGILLFIIAIEMLLGKSPGTKSSAKEEAEALQKDDLVVTPLAIPLLTGPGAITSGIVLFNTAGGITDQLFLFVDIALVYTLSYFILSRSEKIFNRLGHTGTMVIVRIMGLLLATIAVQFIITGVGEAVVDIMAMLRV
jgi:multiple antibiotic resistance protein